MRNQKIEKWLRQWVLHPDPQAGWIPFAVNAGIRLVRQHGIRAIYSTSAPLSCHIIADRIKEVTGIAWIADFRDEWFENPDIPKPSGLHRKFHYRMEKRIVRNADHVITAAPGFSELLRKHDVNPKKIATLTMGFDPRDFKTGEKSDSPPPAGTRFKMAFAGLFYDSFRPTAFLQAVSSLIDEGKIPPDRIRIVFVGANSPAETGFDDRYGICSFTGFVSHRQSVRIMGECDALLLLLSRKRGGFVIPSKTFEYMAADKPILAAVPPDGEAARIINRTDTGIVVGFDDRTGIREALLRFFQAWEKGASIVSPDRKQISNFNQTELTGRLAALLDNITELKQAAVIK